MTDLESLLSWATQRGHYGKQYESAQTRDELMVLLSDAVVISAGGIVKVLRPPERGLFILWVMKKVSRRSYEHYLEIIHGLFVQTILYLTYELREFLKSQCELKGDVDNIVLKASVYAASAFGIYTRMQEDEKRKFREMMIRAIENPPKDSADALYQIQKARGPVPNKVLATFLKAAVLDGPLSLIEPLVFAQKWKALADQTNDKNERKQKNLEEKAKGLVFAARVLIGALHPRLNIRYPELLTLPQDKDFIYFATIAFVYATCIHLHFDVEESMRTLLEKVVQAELTQYPHPPNAMNATDEYASIHRFISQKILKEPDRKKRGQLMFDLAGKWVVLKITDEMHLNERGTEIARAFSDIFMKETAGYWK